jgi:hypothetical protein
VVTHSSVAPTHASLSAALCHERGARARAADFHRVNLLRIDARFGGLPIDDVSHPVIQTDDILRAFVIVYNDRTMNFIAEEQSRWMALAFRVKDEQHEARPVGSRKPYRGYS